MCLIIVCVVEVQFLINTLGNWLELPPHPPAAVCEIMVLYYRLNASSVEFYFSFDPFYFLGQCSEDNLTFELDQKPAARWRC